MRVIKQEPIRELLARLIDNGKAFVQAEIALVKATASGWMGVAKVAAIFFGIAFFLLFAGVIVLFVALGWTLAIWLGPAGGMAAAAVIALLAAGLFAWVGARRIAAMVK